MWRLSKKEKKKKRRESGADAYRYLTGEAEVGGGAAFLACSGAHTAIGAAGWVLPFPPLRGCLSGRLSFGATSKEKQRPCQEHNAYRRRQGVGVCAVCSVHVYMCVGSNSRRFDCQSCMQMQKNMDRNVQKAWVHARMQKEHTQILQNPCFVFFRGETTRVLTSPKTCTSKKEPLVYLHKCSTMDPDAHRNVNLLMISAQHRLWCSSIARTRLKLL